MLFGIQHAPIVFITLRAGLVLIPRDYVEAARAAGMGPARVLSGIVLPLLGPYVIAAAALAFVSGVGNFGIPALLGMPENYLTLATLIYQQLSSNGPTVLPRVAGLSLLICAIAILGVGAQGLALRRRRFALTRGTPMHFALGAGAGPPQSRACWRCPLRYCCRRRPSSPPRSYPPMAWRSPRPPSRSTIMQKSCCGRLPPCGLLLIPAICRCWLPPSRRCWPCRWRWP
ncbi:ABC transporter permease subunit [Devosia sp. A8/3-2]|nr:ABC transporter permease subunit [Devosia sp. A8/3-2]